MFAIVVVTALSLGYDMTQPLFAGVVTSLGGIRAGQAMRLNVFTLFVGFGLGSPLFGELLRLSFGEALGLFAGVELLLALLSCSCFARRFPRQRTPAAVTNTGRG